MWSLTRLRFSHAFTKLGLTIWRTRSVQVCLGHNGRFAVDLIATISFSEEPNEDVVRLQHWHTNEWLHVV